MSVAAIQTFVKEFIEEKRERHIKRFKGEKEFVVPEPSVLEALAATGLRSIRYAKEICGIGSITINDLEPQAVDAINKNLEFNGLTEPKVKANLGDAW
ncbi:RNA methyltransferase tRNA(m5U54)methyltransferase [Entomophthora muscae]|uniref:RNA methyltransferase tRNA(M5U54)methyltransferase n=1 Tax=Entomophthora muscae TaxID=34485 RepID=A0ACC2S228_9FUNG|nr:RNA methyltransferase tRNA(m5U54)methyltransferase [Entomophthora muscae]